MIRLVMALSAIILLQGVTSHIFPSQIWNLGMSMQSLEHIKRQDLDCFIERSTGLSPTCVNRIAAIGGSNDLEVIAGLICRPECGQALLDIFRDCGVKSVTAQILASLCGTNSNGNVCSNMLNQLEDIDGDTACSSATTCPSTCKSLFSRLISQQGCCFNVFLDAGKLNNSRNAALMEELRDTCNIDAPGDCNNSPISGGNTFFEVSLSAILSAMGLIAVLN